MTDIYAFTAAVYEWPARKNWFFVSLPEHASGEIADTPRAPSGFGAVRVRAKIGDSEWTTSIFPGAAREYSLPLKQSVRDSECIAPGDLIAVEIELLD